MAIEDFELQELELNALVDQFPEPADFIKLLEELDDYRLGRGGLYDEFTQDTNELQDKLANRDTTISEMKCALRLVITSTEELVEEMEKAIQ